jgi:Mg2+ and Co2+ transporter CorA
MRLAGEGSDVTSRVYLYDADGRDREIQLDAATLPQLGEHNLVWIDVEHPDADEIARLSDAMEVDPGCFALPSAGDEPNLDNYGNYFRFWVEAAPRHGDPREPGPADALRHAENGNGTADAATGGRIDFLVGPRWLVTIHDAPVPCLERFRDQDKAETMIGLLSPQALAASLLDWHLGEFFQEVSRIETSVDRLDERVLREASNSSLLGRMVAMRRRVSKLRGLLVRQRSIFYGLSRPDFALVTDAGALPFYQSLAGRFERALDEIERARDLVTGSFELFTSRSSQQTNDLVKILTFITAIIGFCAAVAGLLGMNFQLAIFRSGTSGFLAVTGSLVLVALASLIYARHRRWI